MSALAWYAGCGLATLVAQAIFQRLRNGAGSAAAAPRAGLAVRVRHALLEAAGITALWPLIALLLAAEICWPRPKREPKTPFAVQLADLVTRLDLDEIERRERVTDPLGAVPDLPFGHLHPAWQAFLARRSPDQAIWSFDAVDREWGTAWRLTGYVLVGDAGIGEHFTLASRAIEPLPHAGFPTHLLHLRHD